MDDNDWQRVTEAWKKRHPGSYPDRSAIIEEMIEVYTTRYEELEAECNRRAPQSMEQVRAMVDEWNEKTKDLAVRLDCATAYGKAQEEKANAMRDLLRRYIRHVQLCEGCDYIHTGAHYEYDAFTADEWAVLRDLATPLDRPA
jgi:hypothetical protein